MRCSASAWRVVGVTSSQVIDLCLALVIGNAANPQIEGTVMNTTENYSLFWSFGFADTCRHPHKVFKLLLLERRYRLPRAGCNRFNINFFPAITSPDLHSVTKKTVPVLLPNCPCAYIFFHLSLTGYGGFLFATLPANSSYGMIKTDCTLQYFTVFRLVFSF